MERLTERTKSGKATLKGYGTVLAYEQAIDRLAYYEDMEEQGRLVVLPCKIGADIYRLGVKEVCDYWQIAYAEIYEDETVLVDDSDNVIFLDSIGKTVFLDRESAENALKGGAN